MIRFICARRTMPSSRTLRSEGLQRDEEGGYPDVYR